MKRALSDGAAAPASASPSHGGVKKRKAEAKQFKDDEQESNPFNYAFVKAQNRSLWQSLQTMKRDRHEADLWRDAAEARLATHDALRGGGGGEELAFERAKSDRLAAQLEKCRRLLELGDRERSLLPREETTSVLPPEDAMTTQCTSSSSVPSFSSSSSALEASSAACAALRAMCADIKWQAKRPVLPPPPPKEPKEDPKVRSLAARVETLEAYAGECEARASACEQNLEEELARAHRLWEGRVKEATERACAASSSSLKEEPPVTTEERETWRRTLEEANLELDRVKAKLRAELVAETKHQVPSSDEQAVPPSLSDKKEEEEVARLKAVNASLAEEVDASATTLERLREQEGKVLRACGAAADDARSSRALSSATLRKCRLLEEKISRFDFVSDGMKKLVEKKERHVSDVTKQLRAAERRLRDDAGRIETLAADRDAAEAEADRARTERDESKRKLAIAQADFADALADADTKAADAERKVLDVKGKLDKALEKRKLPRSSSTQSASSGAGAPGSGGPGSGGPVGPGPPGGDDAVRMMNRELRAKITCLVCGDREKTTVLTRCFHVFCRECVQQTIANRSRKCPACSKTFGQTDVHDLFLVN
mmetsp:Transcript_32525/g.103720  ORF Transcript_32525/g.103720 Transcript_32525/m.103720 type:complete len:603 (-) Transcript_32525:166-1974(-)